MWNIIANEWKYFSRNHVLSSVTAGFVMVLLVSAILGAMQNRQQAEIHRKAKDHLRAQWENITEMNPHGAAHYGTYIFKPANVLSSLDEGVHGITGNVLRVEGHTQNEIVHSEASQMQTISRLGKLKSSLLLQYLVPILLVFMAFSSINKEKLSGRLKLLIQHGAGPFPLIFAKSLSVWMYGIGLLILSTVVNILFNHQTLDAESIVRILYIFLTYSLYYYIVSSLTLFLSILWRTPALALISMLAIWIVWSIFLPNILMSSVEEWYPLPSRNDMRAAMREERSKGVDGHNPADVRQKVLEQEVLKRYGVDSLSQLPINFDGLVMQADEEYGNTVWDNHFGNIRSKMERQKQTYQLSGILDPFISLQNASMGFAGNDNLHHQMFLLQAEDYRRGFIKMLNDKHAFGGSRTGDWGWKADNAFFRSVPEFDHTPVAIAAVFPHYLMDVSFLTLWACVTTLLLLWRTKQIELL